MTWAKDGCEIQDSKGMTLEQICDWLVSKAKEKDTVLRLQTGDPGLYGALFIACNLRRLFENRNRQVYVAAKPSLPLFMVVVTRKSCFKSNFLMCEGDSRIIT